MKIVFRHPCVLPVAKYGGTERIIYWLMSAMAQAGHKVSFIGKSGTNLQREGIEFFNEDEVDDWRVLLPKDADILHLNYPPNPNEPVDIPTLYTLHGNAKEGESFPENTVCISKKQAQNHNAEFYIYNPVNFDEYPEEYFKQKTGLKNFLFLAKASWSVKNLSHALKVTRKLNKHLHIIGGKTLIPRLSATSHGFLGGEAKLGVMSKCDALLFAVRWHEPFGIAIIEAMALGLPVFGSNYGSLPELIGEDRGRTYNSHQEMIDGLRNLSWQFDSQAIRNSVLDQFNHHQQAQKYIEAYTKILEGENLNLTPISRNMQLNPEGLLPF